MFIKTLLAYLNVFGSFFTLLVLYILRCNYNIFYLDKFMFIKNIDDISFKNNINYYLSHTIIFYIYGILFGIRNIKLIVFKIILFEILLYIIKSCDIKNYKLNENIVYLVLYTIFLNILFYYLGTLVSDRFYNSFFKLDNKFNISFKFS
jgi:hypothetical protein